MNREEKRQKRIRNEWIQIEVYHINRYLYQSNHGKRRKYSNERKNNEKTNPRGQYNLL